MEWHNILVGDPIRAYRVVMQSAMYTAAFHPMAQMAAQTAMRSPRSFIGRTLTATTTFDMVQSMSRLAGQHGADATCG